jgi:transposase
MRRKPYPTSLTDAQWHLVKKHLPPQPALGRRRRHDRRVMNAILYVLRTGIRWCDLPHDLGDDSTAHRWFQRWQEDGTWKRIWLAMLETLDEQDKLDWENALLDGSFVPAKRGAKTWAMGVKGKAPRSTS